MKIILLFVLTFAMIGLMIPNAFSATSVFDEGEEKIILEKNIDVNLVLIGDSWLSSQVTSIKKNLVEQLKMHLHGGHQLYLKNFYNLNYKILK